MSKSNHQSDNQFEHQDWEPCVLRKAVKKTQHKHVDPNVIKMAKLDQTDDIIQIEKISDIDRKLITALRVEKKITQEYLAKHLNLDKSVIRYIENGKHAKNKNLTNKILKYLEKCQTPSS